MYWLGPDSISAQMRGTYEIHTPKKSHPPYHGPRSQMQTLACWIVLHRGNVCARGEPVLWNSLRLDCLWCFDKALRTSLHGEITAWWNKNSGERRREMPKTPQNSILPQLNLPLESVTICIYICILVVLWKPLRWDASRRSMHETCIHTQRQVLGDA